MSAWKSMSLCLLLTLPFVSPAAASPAPPAFLNGDAACAASTPATAAGVSPAALWATSGGCLQGFCTTVAQCSCPSAQTVTCSGGTCHYTFSGGGSGGRTCRQSFCQSSSQCPCSDGSFGTCSGGVCQF